MPRRWASFRKLRCSSSPKNFSNSVWLRSMTLGASSRDDQPVEQRHLAADIVEAGRERAARQVVDQLRTRPD